MKEKGLFGKLDSVTIPFMFLRTYWKNPTKYEKKQKNRINKNKSNQLNIEKSRKVG